MSKRDEQIARMKGLMTYGTTNTSKKTPITESIEGPDGNIYAVIREGTKFYIKSTPKGSELVAESFGYIGGFMNKKNNEFSSYNQAAKNLELKVRSLNEAYGVNRTVELHNPEKKETLMVEMTDAMKASLARYRQIVNEASTISASNTGVPEAPKTTGFSPKLGGPFTNTAEATLDKDLKATASKPENQGEPFGDDEKAEEFKDAQYVPDGSVANKKPAGGKVVRVNENEMYEETIEECDEWGSCGLPSSAGTGEIGDDAPFTETLKENDDKEEENRLPDPPEVVYIDGLNEDAGDADDFAGMPTTTESEDESDIDLDDIDLDLDSDEDMDDEELDDLDTEEDLDDEDFLGDDDDEEVASEESEIEALRTEVEELRELINQLMGDDEESSFELELDDEYDDDEMPEDEYDDYEEDEETEMFPESRQYIQKLVEDVVQYYGVDKMDDEARQRREERNDLKYSPKGDVCWDKAVAAIKAYGEQVRAELQAEYEGKEEDIRFLRLWTGSVKRENYAINCLRNLYRLQYNVNAMRKDGKLDETTLDELHTTISKYRTGLIRNTEGIEDEGLSDVLSTTEGLMFRVQDELQELRNEPELDADYDVDYDTDEEFEEEDDMPNTPARDFDQENDDAAWAAAADFDYRSLDLSSVTPRRLNEEGTRLNVFGKHPGYRKKPMSLPQTGSDEGDWNDSSVYSEQPFGQQVGDSAPFDKVIKSTVEAVMESLKKKL